MQTVTISIKWLVLAIAELNRDFYLIKIDEGTEEGINDTFIGLRSEPLQAGSQDMFKYLSQVPVKDTSRHNHALVTMAMRDVLCTAEGYLSATALIDQVQHILSPQEQTI